MHSARASLLVAFAAVLGCHDGSAIAGRGVTGPRSGGLLFIKQVDGQADLARARIADGAVALISSTPEREERWPYWSDVTRRVVFPARPYGPRLKMDLLLWDPESGEERALAAAPAKDERWPTWSPCAPQLAYAFKRPRGDSGIVLYDLATERAEVLASAKLPGLFLRPAFSPDGHRLVAESRVGRGPEKHLWLLESGRPPQRLTSEPGTIDTKARFSRDGRTILFTRRRVEEGPGDLFRIDLETGIQKPFASLPEADDHSAWHSPTREEIAFISDRDGSHDVFLLDLAEGVPRNLTQSPEIDEAAPLWSPDGERLVILRRPRTEPPGDVPADQHRLAVIDRQGRVLFETQGMMADWMPAWP